MSEAVDYMRRYQAWRRGEDERTQKEAGINPGELGKAIDDVCAEVETWREVSRNQDIALDRNHQRIAHWQDQAKRVSIAYDQCEASLADANARIVELTGAFDGLAREMLSPDVFQRLIDWLRTDPIKSAALAFTSGIERQIAYALEDEVVPLVKSARMIQSRIYPQPFFPTASVELLMVKQELKAFKNIADDRLAQLNADRDQALKWKQERDHWKANHDNQVERARLLIERDDLPIERIRAYQKHDEYRTGWQRYEKLRKLNPRQFMALWDRGLKGERFDDLVDALP